MIVGKARHAEAGTRESQPISPSAQEWLKEKKPLLEGFPLGGTPGAGVWRLAASPAQGASFGA
jgi:hypothetical protein